jgi:RNA polymerase sigma-70 factor, ECF subfamily
LNLGQPGWCETLYRAISPELVLYGRALGLSHSEAEDVAHDTFAALLELHLPPEKPHHYCLRAFRNRALNYRHSLWRRLARQWQSRDWFEATAGEQPLEKEAMHALAALSRDQREVIVLKIWHQHTFEEIGELLQISPNTAAGRYRYGMGKLRTILNRQQNYERRGNDLALLETAASYRPD